MLAFKNDVSFWSSIDTMEGLSTRTLVLNQAMEVVILLYLREQDASWLVQITSVFTLVLGAFKIVKSARVKKRDAGRARHATRPRASSRRSRAITQSCMHAVT